MNLGLVISRSDFPRRIALPLNKQLIELGVNNIPAKGKKNQQQLDHSLHVVDKLDALK